MSFAARIRDHGEAKVLHVAAARLGECPLWSVAEQVLYWVDISGRSIHRLDLRAGVDAAWTMPAEPGCIGLAKGGGLVAALRDGFYRFFPYEGRLIKIAPAPYNTSNQRFNDGKVDALGRFWAGAMFEPRTTTAASIYCLDKGRVRELCGPATGEGVKVSNGLAFSADGHFALHSDTPEHVVYRIDLKRGEPNGRQVFTRVPDNRADPDYGGRPDGAAFDAEGCYWSAQYEGGRVLRFDTEGRVIGTLTVPARRPTMVAFGGPDLRTLFITSARDGADAAELERYPYSGAVFQCQLDVPGRPEPQYLDT
jgi:sugar lactone lactonase YvrE